MKENNFFQILSKKNFLKVWLAQLFSLISATTINFVLIGKIYDLTKSTVAVGFYLFFYYLPTLILGPFVGVFIDNWNKRKIFILSNLLQSGIVLAYLGVSHKVWPIYCIVLFYSFCDEFFNPAVLASVPVVINKNYYTTANSLFFLTTQSSIIIGSLVGGLMLKFLPDQNLIFFIISICLLMATLFSFTLPSKPFKGSKKLKIDLKNPLNLSKAFDLPSFWQQVKEGYQFIKSEPMVLFPILLLAGLQGLVGMGFILFPSLSYILKIEFADSPFYLILPTIFGAILGGAMLEKRIRKIRKNIFILGGLYTFGIIIFLLPIISLLLYRPFLLAVPLGLGLGIGYVFIYIPLQTLIQEHTPFDVRGRVFGTLGTLVNLASFFPMLVTSTLVDVLGVRLVLFLLGTIVLFLSFLVQQKKQMILALTVENENK